MSTSSATHSLNGIRIFDLPPVAGRPNAPPRKVALTYQPTSWGIVDISTGVQIEPYAINWPVEEPISRSEDGLEGFYLSFLGAYAKYTGLKELLVREGILRETAETYTVVKEHPSGILPDWKFELPKVYITLESSEVVHQCFPCQAVEGFKAEDKRFLACGGCHVQFYCSKKCQKMGWTTLGHKERCKAIRDEDAAKLRVLNKGMMKAVYRNGRFVMAHDEN